MSEGGENDPFAKPPLGLARNTPESAMTLIRFTEDRCLPFVEEHKRISTFRNVEAVPEAAQRHHAA